METICGIVRQPDGHPIPDVVVSDGTTVCRTDEQGQFSLSAHDEQSYIMLTVPATHHVPTDAYGRACLYVQAPFPANIVFELAPREQLSARLKAVFVTDLHLGRGQGRQRFIAEAIPAMRAHQPDFVVVGGDLSIQEGVEDEMLPLQARLGCPVFHVIGNHELMTHRLDAKRDFKRLFGPTYYSFEWGNAHLIVLDGCTVAPWRKGWQNVVGFIDERQLGWLEQDLAATAPGKTIIVFIHIPIVSFYSERRGIGSKEEPAWEIINNRAVVELLSKYKVRLVLQGHMHENEHVRRHGVHFIESSSISGAWWNGPNVDGSPQGFRVVDNDGSELATTYFALADNKPVTLEAEAHPNPYRDAVAVTVNVHDGDPHTHRVYARVSGVTIWTELVCAPMVKHAHLWEGDIPSPVGLVSLRVEIRVVRPEGELHAVTAIGGASGESSEWYAVSEASEASEAPEAPQATQVK